MLALTKTDPTTTRLSKFFENARQNGFLALMLKPPVCRKGFAMFFAHIPREADRDAPMRTVMTIKLSANDLRSALVYDKRRRVVPLDQCQSWLEEAATHFNAMAGSPQLFMGGLHLASLIADEDRSYGIDDMPDMAKFAIGRIYQEFSVLHQSAELEKEFPFRSRMALNNLLSRILVPGIL